MEKIGLIAGNGIFPVLFAREARARGYCVVAVAHVGESRPEIDQAADSVDWIRVGQIAKLIGVFQRAGVRRAVMAGGIDKVRSLSRVRPDWRAVRLLGRTLARGDDALLRGLADELATEGIEIVPCTTFLERLLFPAGLVAGPAAGPEALDDIRLGCRVLAALGPLDVGQSVVVEGGVVLAIEAIEGTDETIRRAGALGRGRAVVVKAAKRGQDMRFDVPAVGPRTVETMLANGARTLAVEADRAILLDGEELIALAKRHAITIVGYTSDGEVALA
jgi:DUF1009 family protein